MSIRVIYIPGIGDHRPWLQDKIIKIWLLLGLQADFHTVGWARDEDFQLKLNRLVTKIDELTRNGDKVAIVGVSAGAGAALNAYMVRKDKISAMIYICGKVHGTENINPRYFLDNPAFKQSNQTSDEAYRRLTEADKKKMLYLYSRSDKTVGYQLNRMSGVAEKAIPAIGHIPAIYTAILLFFPVIARFIRSRI